MIPLTRIGEAFGPICPVREGILAGMLADASAAREPVRQVVLDSLARPTRRSMAFAVRSSPEDVEVAAGIAPHAEAVTIPGAPPPAPD